MNGLIWKPVTTAQILAASAGFALLCYFIATDHAVYKLLNAANWAFHEFGHPFFRIFGDVASLYGGTLMELIVPLVCAVAFLRQGEPVGVAVAGVWFFQNFFYIAWYMDTSRADFPDLPDALEHDWDMIFTRWGVVAIRTQIAHTTQTLGWIGIALVWGWLLWRWRQWIRHRDSDAPNASRAPSI